MLSARLTASAELQWNADFNPSTAHLEIDDRRIAESRRWCELKSAAQIMRPAASGAKRPFIGDRVQVSQCYSE
jgi:hypothetical protein